MLARIFGSLAAIIGLIGALGYLCDVAVLRFASGGTDIGVLLCGTALVFLTLQPTKARSAVITLLSGISVAVSFISILHHHAGVNVGAMMPGATYPPGLIDLISLPVNEAVELVVVGLSIMCRVLAPRLIHLSQGLALSGALVSVMTSLGLLFGFPYFCLYACLRISWPIGLAWMALCAAIVLCQTDRGPFAILSQDDAGGAICRRFIPAVLGTPLLLGWLRVEAQHAGIVDESRGLGLMVIAFILLFLIVVWRTCTVIGHADSARKTALDNLARSEHQMRRIINQSTDAFIAVDSRGHIRDWNPKAEAMFGWTRSEAIASDIRTKIGTGDDSGDPASLFYSGDRTDSMSQVVESVGRHKEGREFPIELSLFLVTMNQNERLMCAFIRDISERKEVETRFRDFYSVVSHELRSPLMAISGCLTTIQELTRGDSDERLSHILQIAESSCDRLLRLVNDLLDVKRIEEGKLELALLTIDPRMIVQQSIEELTTIARHANVVVKSDIRSACPCKGDDDRIVQVLTNLIANAIKFSPPGGAVIVRVERRSDFVRFSVFDEGSGLATAQLPKLFRRFGQLASRQVQKRVGTGLGLAISKSIIDQHGGTIGVESSKGKGSNFWFELPVDSDEDEESGIAI